MMLPDGSHAIPIRVPDYSPNDADREWVERELGDAPMVTAKDRPVYDQTPAFSAATTDALMFGTGAYKVSQDGTALPVDMYVDPECFWG